MYIMRLSQRLRRHQDDIRALGRAKAEKRRRMLRESSNDLILALVDAAKMIINGEVTLTPRQLSTVVRHRPNFERLVKPSTSVSTKRRIVQEGGFVGALLGPLLKIGLPLIGNILGGLGGRRQ